MADLGLTSIGHLAIRAKDLDTVVRFYVEQLDCAEMFRLHRDNGDLMLVYLRLTDDQYLEFFPNGTGEAPAREAVGMSHLCITVADLDVTVAELERRGVAITRGIITGLDGNRQAWIADPEGNRIELMEMAADSGQAKAITRLRQG